MGINRVTRRGKRRIEVRKRWPDGTTFRRYYPNMTVAKEMLSRIEVAIHKGSWPELQKELAHGITSDMSVAEYSDHYLEVYCKVRNKASTWSRKTSTLKHIKRLLGQVKLEQLDMRKVHGFVANRLREEVTSATVNRDISVLRHMYEFAVDEGTLPQNPIARIKMLKEFREERPRVNEQQLQRILKQLPFPVRQIVLFIYETGCRPSEALALKWAHVDLEGKTAVFNMRKAGDNALVALSSRAVKALGEIPILPDCPYVFWNPKTQTRYERINETFRRAREKAGLPTIQLKDFRRELGIVIAESGQPLHVAKTQLGHSSVRTTEKYYAHYSPEFAISRAREVMETRGSHLGATPPTEEPPQPPSPKGASNIVNFQQVRRASGGGGRIRTGE